MQKFIGKLNSLSRQKKKLLIFSLDVLLVLFSLCCSLILSVGTTTTSFASQQYLSYFVMVLLTSALAIYFMRLHQIKLQAMDHSASLRIGGTAAILTIVGLMISVAESIPNPVSVAINFGVIFFVSSVIAKVLSLNLLLAVSSQNKQVTRVAIYGAGAAGIQLAAALRQTSETKPCFFVDENPNLQGLFMNGLPVIAPKKLEKYVSKHHIGRILLAMPSVDRNRRNAILKDISKYALEVMVLPSYADLMANGGVEEALRPVTADELLGRDKVELDIPEMAEAYNGRSIIVTGAGGSIGSELCRQLVNRGPSKLVLFEQNEFSLYAIDREIRALVRSSEKDIEIVTRLGSVTNRSRIQDVIRHEGIEIILHAAAYKHVPIVEDNELEGANNNVLGTQIVADVAADEKIERFILVSTDKAVRPTNVMGATKRMAELVIQDIQSRSSYTKFAMVRFGNVLGSSGSVLPLFQSQIQAGGPVTVTHSEVTRFFMTIPEAARLVLLAGAYSSGGDLFVLDMGRPQKIIDIARRMIQLSGRTVKDSPDDDGDIELQIVGLRPGEKLYEELLIDDNSLIATPHPKILRAQEEQLSEIEVASMLKELNSAITSGNSGQLRRTIKARVVGYHQPESEALTA